MPVDPRILDVQAHDLALDRLRRRRAELPEAAELAAAEARREAELARYNDMAAARAEAESVRDRLAGEADTLTTKIDKAQRRLMGGTVTNPRELSALQADVAMLRRQRDAIEDEELDAMEKIESLGPEIDASAARIAALDAEITALSERVVAARADIDREIAAEEDARSLAAQSIAAALLDAYDRMRARNGGIGAARLTGRLCQACNVQLSPGDVEEAKDAPVPRCTSCGVIVVIEDAA
jgi:predicted  nucleic acid-binding Zn-ribbon protein